MQTIFSSGVAALLLRFKLALIATTVLAATANAQLLSDPLEAGTNWTVAQEPFGADSAATFGYDYSADSIPEAPNSDVAGGDAATTGLKFEVNTTTGSSQEIFAFSNQSFTGQYTVQADIWINYPLGGAGTTEFAGLGVGSNGQFGGGNVTGTAYDGFLGASLVYTGDGDSARDYRLYKGGTDDTFAFISQEQFIESAQYSGDLGDLSTDVDPRGNNNSHPILQAAYPGIDASQFTNQGQTGTTADGAAAMQWMSLTIEVDPDAVISEPGPNGRTGTAKFTLASAASGESLVIGTIDNSNTSQVDVPLEGNVGLIMADVFTSVSSNASLSFALFDNILITEGVSTPPNANFNGDEIVDAEDYTIWRDNLGLAGTADLMTGDANGDGDVNEEDYAVWVEQFGDAVAGSASLNPGSNVPEPATISVCSVLLATLATLRFKRRSAAS